MNVVRAWYVRLVTLNVPQYSDLVSSPPKSLHFIIVTYHKATTVISNEKKDSMFVHIKEVAICDVAMAGSFPILKSSSLPYFCLCEPANEIKANDTK